MGGSGKWIKSLIGLKKSQTNDHEKVGGDHKGRKWKMWRSSSGGVGLSSPSSSKHKGIKGGRFSESDVSSNSIYVVDGASFAGAMATVVRAPRKDFMLVRKEWAAIQIQTKFRAFLARRALKALKALVRLQAIVRGRLVRKQAAVTYRCMQALVRVQALARAKSVQSSPERQLQNRYPNQHDPLKRAVEGWCDGHGTVDEVRAKLQMKQEGAIKRERAIAYALSKQKLRTTPNLNSRKSKDGASHKIDKNTSEWSWLEGWMAAKPWESRLMEEFSGDPSESTPLSKKYEDCGIGSCSNSSESGVQIRRNNISTRICAKRPITRPITRSCFEFHCDESTTSNTSASTSETPRSNKIPVDGSLTKPNYMSLTQSIKAKQRASSCTWGQLMDNLQFRKKLSPLSRGELRRTADSDLYSNDMDKDLYPPLP